MNRFSNGVYEVALPECMADHVDRGSMSSANVGWWPLLEEMHARLDAVEPGYRLVQVKEKLGILRVYVADASDEPSSRVAVELKIIISEYEHRSAEICEGCGGAGHLVELPPGRRLATLCDCCVASRRVAFA